MQLTLQIDDDLLAEAANLGAPQVPQQLVTEALLAYLHQRRRFAALQKTAGPTVWEVLDEFAGTVDGPEDWAEAQAIKLSQADAMRLVEYLDKPAEPNENLQKAAECYSGKTQA